MENKAKKELSDWIEEAVSARASQIVLEWVPEGLEVCFMLGDTGVCRVIENRKLAGAIMELIADRAGLDDQSEGTMTWLVQGGTIRIAVEEYDSFGECCFRLKLGKRSPKPGKSGIEPKRKLIEQKKTKKTK